VQLFGHVPDTRIPATTAYVKGKSLGIKGIIGQPTQLLLLHFPALATEDSADLHVQVDPHVSAGQVSNSAELSVVEDTVNATTRSTNCFFPLRLSRIVRAWGSPKIPETVC